MRLPKTGLATICHDHRLGLRSNMKIKYLWPLAALLLTGCVTRTYTVNTPPPGPSLAEVQSMAQAHVSDAVIVSQIQNSMINPASKPPVQAATTVDQSSYVYPYVYVDPWPWFWWGYGPYYYGGYYRGGYHYGGGYHGGGYHHGH